MKGMHERRRDRGGKEGIEGEGKGSKSSPLLVLGALEVRKEGRIGKEGGIEAGGEGWKEGGKLKLRKGRTDRGKEGG